MIGWPEVPEFPLDMVTVMDKELDVRGVNRYCNVFPSAIALIAARRINVAPLVTHTFPLENIKEAFEFCLAREDNVVKVVVTS